MRLLIVDDSDEHRRFFRRILAEQEDLILEAEAADGEAGILLAQQLKPDVIFMDIRLPGMDGLEAARRIKEHHAQAMIIILSNDEVHCDAAETCGADAFLPKSSSISELLAVVRRRQPTKAGCLFGPVDS